MPASGSLEYGVSSLISKLADRALRSFRVTFAFRFVSTQQVCLFLWADFPTSLSNTSKATCFSLFLWADFLYISKCSFRSFRVSFRVSFRSNTKGFFSSGRTFLLLQSQRQSFLLGGLLSLQVLGPNESGGLSSSLFWFWC